MQYSCLLFIFLLLYYRCAQSCIQFVSSYIRIWHALLLTASSLASLLINLSYNIATIPMPSCKSALAFLQVLVILLSISHSSTSEYIFHIYSILLSMVSCLTSNPLQISLQSLSKNICIKLIPNQNIIDLLSYAKSKSLSFYGEQQLLCLCWNLSQLLTINGLINFTNPFYISRIRYGWVNTRFSIEFYTNFGYLLY